MKLTKCSCCKRDLRTKDVKKLAREAFENNDFLYVNCKFCNSTLLIAPKAWQKRHNLCA